eukprot:364418-Chlamydomonas_euryale.AAC.10
MPAPTVSESHGNSFLGILLQHANYSLGHPESRLTCPTMNWLRRSTTAVGVMRDCDSSSYGSKGLPEEPMPRPSPEPLLSSEIGMGIEL